MVGIQDKKAGAQSSSEGHQNDANQAKDTCNQKARAPPRISPPPLKRQRISSPLLHSGNLRTPRQGSNSALSSFYAPFSTESSTGPHQDKKPAHFGTASRIVYGQRAHEDDEISTSSGILRSEPSNVSSTSSRACRSCSKSITKGFDPLIICPSCQRPYHDACRKPPLTQGEDPTSWTCFKCTSSGRKARSTFANQFLMSNSIGNLSNKDKISKIATKGGSLGATSSTKKPFAITSLDTKKRPSTPETRNNKAITSHEVDKTIYHTHTEPLGKGIGVSGKGGTINTTTNCKTKEMPLENVIDKKTLLNHPTDGAQKQLVVGATQAKDWHRSSGRALTADALLHHTEIPNTPDQRSSQIQIESSAPEAYLLQLGTTSRHGNTDNTVLDINQSETQKITNSVPCYICSKRTVVVGITGKNVKWQVFSLQLGQRAVVFPNDSSSVCKKRADVLKSHKIRGMVPETPESIQSRFNNAETSPQRSATTTSSSNEGNSTSAFCCQTGPIRAKDNEFPAKKVPSVFDTNIDEHESAQLTAPSFKSLAQTHIFDPSPCETRSTTQSIIITKTGSTKLGKMLAVPMQNESARRYLSEDVSPIAKAGNVSNSAHSSTRMLGHDDEIPEQYSFTVTQLTQALSFLDADALRPLSLQPLQSVAQSPSIHEMEPYTNKEFIGMALLAAGGGPLSAAQVINWIEETFPEQRKGGGVWEKSVFAVLSKGDFQGKNISGQKHRIYTFASTTIHKMFEEQFSGHPALVRASSQQTPPGLPVRAATEIIEKILPIGQERVTPPILVDKTPLSDPLESEVQNRDSEIAIFEPSSINARLSIQDINGVFMPFEQPGQFHNGITDSPDTKQETNFFKAFPEYTKPSIETMTEADIEKKIAVIKTRPSRKAKWGIRLAYARPHRHDVHDEASDAWDLRLPIRSHEKRTTNGEVNTQDVEAAKSLKDIFDLPKNPIPILYEGQLAFRDGTLVNGKLPRSRIVYKVGKKLGEVRT